jgi:hypothetical protein
VRKYLFSSSDSEGWKHAYAASKAMVDACESDELVDIAAQAANGADIILVR